MIAYLQNEHYEWLRITTNRDFAPDWGLIEFEL